MKLDRRYRTLGEGHLFAQIADRVRQFTNAHPERAVLKLGLSEGTRPLPPAVTSAMQMAISELGTPATFKGYGPTEGYPALRRAIQEYYKGIGVALELDDIFVSTGAKDATTALSELFAPENTVLLQNPTHPVYEEISLLAGRPILYVDCNEDNGFLPPPPSDVEADLIYLASPANPTGAAYTREGLAEWVAYANARDAVILFDAAYEAFVCETNIPRSIYEIPGAHTCAIEICSFSKTAGFTGLRCGYTVIPASLVREGQSLRDMWERLLSAKTGGVSYPVQMGAIAALSPEGQRQAKENLRYYLRNAARITSLLSGLDIPYCGGVNSPYVWVRCPAGMDAWAVFDVLLAQANVVCTPGGSFGKQGDAYIRFSAFNSRENTARAVERLRPVLAELYGKNIE